MINGLRARYLGALAIGLLAAPLVAQSASEVQRARHHGYERTGAAFKKVNDTLRSGEPKLDVIRASAKIIQNTAKLQYGWFPAGSGPAPGVKTDAKSEIWSNRSDFKLKQDEFAKQAQLFATVAAGTDIDAIKAQAKALGATCGACHKPYKKDKG